MKTPPLLLGITIVFWGWHTGMTAVAVAMALVLEGSRIIKWRWQLSSDDFNHIADLCSVLLLGTVIYLYGANRSSKLLLLIFQWLPLPLFPLILSLAYSTRNEIDLSSLFFIYRKKIAKRPPGFKRTVELDFPYFAISIFAASVANSRSIAFYICLCVLSAWALWSFRSLRFSVFTWLIFFIAISYAGYQAQVSLHRFQQALEQTFTKWIEDFIRNDADPYQSATAMGDILEIKKSGKILLRIKPFGKNLPPKLLRTATYNIFNLSVWFASDRYFEVLPSDPEKRTWQIGQRPRGTKNISVSAFFKNGRGILAMPNGTFQIRNLPAVKIERNRFNTVKIDEAPGFATFQLNYNPRYSSDSPPDENDMKIPSIEAPCLTNIAKELELSRKSPHDILNTLDTFFRTRFRYSLKPHRQKENKTALTNFLTRTRSGHCEYFATATVLLLRTAGIPARYATGYAVHEYSRLEKMFIVRQRHAHAWALVYVDGRWQDFDTTPQSWISIENKMASKWQPVFDFLSHCVFLFSKWKWGERNTDVAHVLIWFLIPLLFFFTWRMYSRKRLVRTNDLNEGLAQSSSYQGSDSEFYLIVQSLHDMGFNRHPWETLYEWLRRLRSTQSVSVLNGDLENLLKLHYRYRFDPNMLQEGERAELRTSAESWVKKLGEHAEKK